MSNNRRQFLLGCGAGALGAMTAPARARAESRLRLLGEPADVERPGLGGQVSPDFPRWMGAVRVGPAAAHGAAVFAGTSLLGLDLFHAPSLFGREWPKLLRAHAVEAYRRPPAPDTLESRLRAQVEGMVDQAARAEGTLRSNAGVDQIFEFRLSAGRGPRVRKPRHPHGYPLGGVNS